VNIQCSRTWAAAVLGGTRLSQSREGIGQLRTSEQKACFMPFGMPACTPNASERSRCCWPDDCSDRHRSCDSAAIQSRVLAAVAMTASCARRMRTSVTAVPRAPATTNRSVRSLLLAHGKKSAPALRQRPCRRRYSVQLRTDSDLIACDERQMGTGTQEETDRARQRLANVRGSGRSPHGRAHQHLDEKPRAASARHEISHARIPLLEFGRSSSSSFPLM
jgi:hypothetical protein